MRKLGLEIGNVGLIRKAVVRLDGITVITGHNKTGKSTIGKVLYALARGFNSQTDYKAEFRNRVVQRLGAFALMLPRGEKARKIPDGCAISRLLNGTYEKDEHAAVKSFLDQLKSEIDALYGDSLLSDALDDAYKFILGPSPEDYADGHVETMLSIEFNNNFTPVRDLSSESKVVLGTFVSGNGELHGIYKATAGNNRFTDFNARVGYQSVLPVPIYIDDAYILDDLMSTEDETDKSVPDHRSLLRRQLRECQRVLASTMERLGGGQELESVLNLLHGLLPGSLESSNGSLVYKENGYGTLQLGNLATGEKFFTVLSMLLQSGQLAKDGLLILDEPEAHLHPGWINMLASVIVLLHKTMNISTVMTTQSVNMVLAIEAFSTAEGVEDDASFYKPEKQEDGMVRFEEADDMRDVYGDLVADYERAYNLLLEQERS